MNTFITIQQAAELLGVSSKTIRRWEKEGKIPAIRTTGGHRRFDKTEILKLQSSGSTALSVAYARVNSKQFQDILSKQVSILKSYCQDNGWNYQLIQDYGGNINYSNKELVRLLQLICRQQVKRLIVTHKERLYGTNSDFVLLLCEIFNIEVIIINDSESKLNEEELELELKKTLNGFKSYNSYDFFSFNSSRPIETQVISYINDLLGKAMV